MVVNDVTHSNEINYIHRSNNEHLVVSSLSRGQGTWNLPGNLEIFPEILES